MPFPEAIRSFVKRAQSDQCLSLHYSEQKGFTQCNNPINQVHHLQPEAWVLAGNDDFSDPNQSTPVGLCNDCHKGKHPDLQPTIDSYRKGDKDAYREMGHTHHRMAQEGVIYWNPDTDESMIERVRETLQRYTIEHPEDRKPQVKPHKDAVRRHWTDIFMGTRIHQEDEY